MGKRHVMQPQRCGSARKRLAKRRAANQCLRSLRPAARQQHKATLGFWQLQAYAMFASFIGGSVAP